jgi:hypothetical protein
MVYLDNVRQLFKDHPELFGSTPEVPFAGFLAVVSPDSLGEFDCETCQYTVVSSGEVARILGEEGFELFGRDLELPAHRNIIARAFTG